MPLDIRSFFGGKGDPVVSKDPPANTKERSKGSKPSNRGKRKVLSDSDDDDLEHSAVKPNQKAPAPRKQMKRESPVGEVTTSSDYFAASGKAKPSRSTPVKSKLPSSAGNTHFPKMTSAKSTPKPKSSPTKALSSTRTSSRKKSRPDYALCSASEDEDSASHLQILKDDQVSGDDIFEAEYKNNRHDAIDEYESDEAEDVAIQPNRRSTKRHTQTVPAAKNEAEGTKRDHIKHIPTNGGTRNTRTPAHEVVVSKGKKRKSHELDGDDDEEDNVENDEGQDEDDFGPAIKKNKSTNTKAKLSVKKSPAKKRREAQIKDAPEKKSEVQDIFDSIPTIRPPTPPDRNGSKKFDFRAAAQRSGSGVGAGSKDIPIGAENCLTGLNFVFTGLLEALQRDEGIELVKRYGGKVTGGPSSKTSYVVLGNDAGPKKLETIAKYNLKVINENGLFELIRRLPANGGDGKAAEKFEAKQKEEERKAELLAAEMEKQERRAARDVADSIKASNASNKGKAPGISRQQGTASVDSRLWTVKYAPTTTGMICGNKSQVDKLQAWLRSWPGNLRTQFRKAGRDGFGVYRAVMIHGPPGIGKTTAAHLAVKLEGYDVVESNASDTRSKKLVETGLKGVLDTTSLLGYFAGSGKKVETEKRKLVLIMDEVDGMSAGDRGGVGALAAACKKTTIPIILICNDRRLPKMKPFDNVTFDLQFKKPTVDQIRSRIMTICYREGLKIPINVINSLIEGSRADIRQVINMLSTAKLDQDAMDFDQSKKMSKSWEKRIILKPWDIVNKILGGGMFASSSTSSLNDKIELYFNDHEFSSLMLQENYLSTQPILANIYSGKERALKLLELVDNAAESISDGDLVDRMIHGSQQQWSLMPTHAAFSFVRPASFMSGSLAGNQTRFTSWLGNNSKQGKLMRFLKEIQAHMRLRASGDRHEIRQQYLPILWYRLVQDLERRGKECVDEVIRLMDSYFLTKDDWEALLELAVGPMAVESVKIDAQTKSSFTRLYNQQSHPLPFMKANSIVAPKKSSGDKPDLEEAMDGSDDEDPILDVGSGHTSEDEILDLKKDKYVKQPKKKAVSKAATKKMATKGKGEEKVKDNEGVDDGESDEAEDVRPKKGKGPAKGKAANPRGRPRKQ